MAKPKSPLLSLGARGTIANGLTFQKRGRTPFVREKPIPKDPKSEAQLAWRQTYRDAVAAWHALSAEEKEAWRGVCPGLTAYQCFIRSELKKVVPPITIDIGSDAIDRASTCIDGSTRIDKNNPANASGTLHTVQVYAFSDLKGFRVGTFYSTNGNTLKCRDSVLIGDVEAGAQRTFPGLSFTVEAGDYIGCFFTGGIIERDTSGYPGYWSIVGEYIDPGDEAIYSFHPGYAISLYGIGEPAP